MKFYFSICLKFLKGFAVLSFLASPSTIHAQEQSVISHHKFSMEDTMGIYHLIRKADEYIYAQYNIDSAKMVLEQARSWSEQVGYPDGVAAALMVLGKYYGVKREYGTALRYIRAAEPFCRHAVYYSKRLKTYWYMNMAYPFSSMGSDDSAIWYIHKATEEANDIEDSALLFPIYVNMGSLWVNSGHYRNAIRYLHYAESLSRSLDRDDLLLRLYANLTSTYDNLNDTARLIKYAVMTLQKSQELGDVHAQQMAYISLGNYYLRSRQAAKALQSYRNSLDIADSSMLERTLYGLWGMGVANLELKQFAKAEYYLLKTLSIIKASDGNTHNLGKIYLHLSDLYRKTGDADKVFSYMHTYAGLKDSMLGQERNRTVEELEAKYKVSEKNKEIALQEARLLKQKSNIRSRNAWIFFISIGALSLGVLLYTSRRSFIRKVHILKQKDEIALLKAMMDGEEKERTRLAGELHDGISSLVSAASINLNTLGGAYQPMTSHPVYERLRALLKQISKDVRKTAHNLMPDVLLQHNLEEAIRLHCTSINRDDDLEIDIQTFGDFSLLDNDRTLAIYRIIQELTQNILKHAAASQVFVQLHIDEELLSITIEDNGIGFKQGKENDGIGLRNIMSRVTYLKGRLSIDSEEHKGTSVYIEVPLGDEG